MIPQKETRKEESHREQLSKTFLTVGLAQLVASARNTSRNISKEIKIYQKAVTAGAKRKGYTPPGHCLLRYL
jgi:hypothetical protein